MAIAEQMQIDSRNPTYMTGKKMTREGLAEKVGEVRETLKALKTSVERSLLLSSLLGVRE